MLVKAGVVIGTAVVGVLAVSPFAFAHDSDHGHHGRGHGHGHGGGGGLINVSDIGVQVPVQLCNNSIIEGTLGILARNQSNDDSHDGDCRQGNRDDD
jgi:hypothetical protein